MRPGDYYLQPDAPDPVLEPATVLALAHRHAPGARELTGVDETGGEARAYAIDDDLILKTQRPHRLRPSTSLEKETFFLDQLAGVPGVRVPRVLGYGREGAVEYILMTRMPGVAMRYAELDAAARDAALRAVGRMLRRIHAVDQAPFVASPLLPGDRSRDDLVARLGAQLEASTAAIARQDGLWPLASDPAALSGELLDAVPAHVDLAALHSNPGPPHAFVDADGGAFAGLIDFGDAYLSHPAFDLRTWSALADRRALLAGYAEESPLSDGWLRMWHVAMVVTEIARLAAAPARRDAVAENLAALLPALRG